MGTWAGLGLWLSPETMPFSLLAFAVLGLAWLLVPRWGALGLASAYAMAFSITSLGLFLFVTRRKACWGAAA